MNLLEFIRKKLLNRILQKISSDGRLDGRKNEPCKQIIYVKSIIQFMSKKPQRLNNTGIIDGNERVILLNGSLHFIHFKILKAF